MKEKHSTHVHCVRTCAIASATFALCLRLGPRITLCCAAAALLRKVDYASFAGPAEAGNAGDHCAADEYVDDYDDTADAARYLELKASVEQQDRASPPSPELATVLTLLVKDKRSACDPWDGEEIPTSVYETVGEGSGCPKAEQSFEFDVVGAEKDEVLEQFRVMLLRCAEHLMGDFAKKVTSQSVSTTSPPVRLGSLGPLMRKHATEGDRTWHH